VNFFINEFFVYFLEATLSCAFVYHDFGETERSYKLIHRAMLASKGFDNSTVVSELRKVQ
jgi:hypothetical protein